MSLISKIAEIVEVLNALKQLKVALGFTEDASITDIIKEVEGAKTALAAATSAETPAS